MKTVENYTNREWYYRAGYKVVRIFTTGCMPVMEDTTESSEMMVVARNFPDSPNSVLIPLEKFHERCLCPATLLPGDLVARLNHGLIVQIYRVAEEESGAALSSETKYNLVPLNFGDLTPTGGKPVPNVDPVVTSENVITVSGETKTIMGRYFKYITALQLDTLKYDALRENVRRIAVKISGFLNKDRWREYTSNQFAALEDIDALIKSATKIIKKVDGEEE